MKPRLQFSLRTLIVATALFAAVCSLWRKPDEEPVTKVSLADLGKTHVLLGRPNK